MGHRMSRRTMLGAGVAVAATAGLGACANDDQPSAEQAAENAGVEFPTYQPAELIEPDLPGTETIMPGYFSYPKNPEPAFSEPPGAGLESLTVMYTTFQPASPTDTPYFQQLEAELGTALKLLPVPSGDYDDKFQTMAAGDDLPDVMMFPWQAPNLPAAAEKLTADLGAHLSGDAIKDYPFLANIPTYSWKPTIANGTIFAIPQSRSVNGGVDFYRTDILEEFGLPSEPADFDEYLEILKTVTDPSANRFAFSNTSPMLTTILGMLDCPNMWSESGGTFTSAYTDERYRQGLGIVADMVKQGLAHPEAATLPYAQHRELFYAGTTVFLLDGYAGYELFSQSLDDPAQLGMMVMPAYEGGGDSKRWANKGFQSITAINKNVSEEDLPKVLKVLDFLAAPIGSREHLHRKYGIEGTDFEWQGDLPKLTDTGTRNLPQLQYVVDAPTVLGPATQDQVEQQYAWHERVAKQVVSDPSIGLYSETMTKASGETRVLNDVIEGVKFGRYTLEEFDEAVAEWRKKAGDQIAAELGEALASQS